MLDRAEQRIFQINQTRKSEGFHRIKELTWFAMERIEELSRHGQDVTGVPSLFSDLDKLTLCFQLS